ncbi:MAG: endopeptidase La, partial [Deltaproteobacteria bacterium]|nr:endopeptidase La [Deltaproteobacteria bacterium]
RIPVRKGVAMTGEITLRGKVLPIGGLKEKLLAAHRAGIPTVLVPKENEKDLKDIPAQILRKITPVLVSHMDEVLVAALNVKGREEIFIGAPPSSDKEPVSTPPVPPPATDVVIRH